MPVLSRQTSRILYAPFEQSQPRNTRIPTPTPPRSSILQRTTSQLLIDEDGDVEMKENDTLLPVPSLFPPPPPEVLGNEPSFLPPVPSKDEPEKEKEPISTNTSTPPLQKGVSSSVGSGIG